MVKKLLLSFLLLTIFTVGGNAQTESIKNGVSWFDTDGNRIRANGASILEHDGKYYMTGMDFTGGYNGLFGRGIKLYSSTDLMNWTFENVIIEADANEQLATGERFLVRPNLVYNEQTDTFIIWSGYKNRSQTYGAVAIFSSKTVNGSYQFEKEIQPLGYDSNDSSMFVDDDGTGYYISNSKNDNSLNIYKLASDYMSIASSEPTILFAGASKEAPVVFKKNGYYYLINSRKTGWNPNQGQYATSLSMTSGWSALRNFGNRLTYDTQPTTFFSVKGSATTSFFYVGDRWQDPDLTESKIIFLPMEASNGNLKLQYVPELRINMSEGTWEAYDNNEYVPNDNWSVVSISSQQNTTNFAAKNVFDNNISSIWNTRYTSGNDRYPHEMVIDLGNQYDVSGFMCVPRQDISGNTISDFQLFLSKDGIDWGAPVAAGRMSYWSELYFETKSARFMKLVGHADLNGSRFASAAEFKLMTSSEYSAERDIIPYFNPDEKGWRAGDKILVERGGQALLGVQTEFGSGLTPFYGSYSYHGPNGYYANSRIINLQNIEEEQLGVYTITYLNDLFSAQQHTYELGFTMLTKDISFQDVICYGNATGTATIEVEGGFSPYTYEWSDGQVTQEATDLVAGTYEVIVSDSEGNSITESIVISEPGAVTFELTSDQLILKGYGEECVDLNVESITGGSGTYTYSWSTGETSEFINVCPNETTVYSVEVTDSEGCVVTKQVTVEVINVDCTTGNGMDKVEICWQGKPKCVAESALPALLRKGARIGSFDNGNQLVIEESTVSPNPTLGSARLKVISRISANMNMKIYNISGVPMITKNISVEEGVNYFDLDLSSQMTGVYMVRINGDNFQSETIKIVKN